MYCSWRHLVCTAALFVVVVTSTVRAGTQSVELPALTLTSIFDQGVILEDRNGDTVTDFVNVRFVLGDSPSASDVSAAANVAARLGFESMAIGLPLTDADSDSPVVAIGTAGMARLGLSPSSIGLNDLAIGEGLVVVTRVRDVLTIVLAGPDDAGTRAAAELFAGRLPKVWDPKGAALTDVVNAAGTFLDVPVGRIAVPNARVTAGGAAIDRLGVVVRFDAVDAL
ncbi:MAG TPA: hypothetical protein EYN90_06525, partial [Acidobacteria bacterium]|nr:hypothetical protein [Acidobacteriota bacterium]